MVSVSIVFQFLIFQCTTLIPLECLTALIPWCNCPTHGKHRSNDVVQGCRKEKNSFDILYQVTFVCVCAKLTGMTRTCTQFSLTSMMDLFFFPVHIHSFSILVFTISLFFLLFLEFLSQFAFPLHADADSDYVCMMWCDIRRCA